MRYDASVDVEQLGDSSNWNVAANRPIDVIEHALWAFFSEIVRVVEFKLSFFIFHHKFKWIENVGNSARGHCC